jgi:nucleoside-diphosphate-sugar epimerase
MGRDGDTVLVTGGAGYIGSILTHRLLQRGYRVRILDRMYWGERPLADLGVLDKVELHYGDVREISDDVLQGVDAVIHMAGLSNDPTAEYDPEANWQMNAVATQRLGEACKRFGIRRLTFGSSCSVYDGLPPGRTLDETATLNPRGAYATSKFYAEQRLVELADESFCPVILRQGTVYGFSPRMRYDLVVNTFVKDGLQKGKLFLHGGGWMWRPLVDVTDVAEAHIECLEADEELVRGEIFNVVHDNYQIRELAMLVTGSLQLHGHRVDLEVAPAPSLVRDYKCSNWKIRQAIGFEPKVTVLESIEHMLQNIQSNGFLNFTHPRYYNIDWMNLLTEVTASQRSFASIY